MAKPSITDARSITADLILEVGKYYSAQQLRSLQAKFSGTAREIRALTSGCHLPGRIGAQLSVEQIQLLQDAAKLIESVNSNIKHAKEKRGRDESQAKQRQQGRYAEAKRLVAETYPEPFVPESTALDPLLDILKTALTLNRADVFRNGYSPREFNLRLRDYLSPARTRKLIGWTSPSAFWISTVLSLRNDVVQTVEQEIAYDDGSSVQNRLDALKQKVADCLAHTHLSADEEETLRLWSEALSPAFNREGTTNGQAKSPQQGRQTHGAGQITRRCPKRSGNCTSPSAPFDEAVQPGTHRSRCPYNRRSHCGYQNPSGTAGLVAPPGLNLLPSLRLQPLGVFQSVTWLVLQVLRERYFTRAGSSHLFIAASPACRSPTSSCCQAEALQTENQTSPRPTVCRGLAQCRRLQGEPVCRRDRRKHCAGDPSLPGMAPSKTNTSHYQAHRSQRS